MVLLNRNIEDKKELTTFFREELKLLFKARRQGRSFKRTKQDFYILWYVLAPLNHQMIKQYRFEINESLREIFYKIRSNTEKFTKDSFILLINNFHQQYSCDKRKIKLSIQEQSEMLKKQSNICAISGTPLFIGDEIHVDHNISLATGGKDCIENLQITHRDSNQKKGANIFKPDQ